MGTFCVTLVALDNQTRDFKSYFIMSSVSRIALILSLVVVLVATTAQAEEHRRLQYAKYAEPSKIQHIWQDHPTSAADESLRVTNTVAVIANAVGRRHLTDWLGNIAEWNNQVGNGLQYLGDQTVKLGVANNIAGSWLKSKDLKNLGTEQAKLGVNEVVKGATLSAFGRRQLSGWFGNGLNPVGNGLQYLGDQTVKLGV